MKSFKNKLLAVSTALVLAVPAFAQTEPVDPLETLDTGLTKAQTVGLSLLGAGITILVVRIVAKFARKGAAAAG